MSEETEPVEAEEGESAAPIKRKLGRWANIAAAVVAAVTAVLVSLGIWDREQSESVTADADCLARCLAEGEQLEEGDPGFMGPFGDAMLSEEPAEEPAEDPAEEVETSAWPD